MPTVASAISTEMIPAIKPWPISSTAISGR